MKIQNLKSKIQNVGEIKIRSPQVVRFKEITRFVSGCGTLVGHDPHFYKIILDYFGDTAFIAEDENGRICGWTFGFASQRKPELFFLWQIGVDSEIRRGGIGRALLNNLILAARKKGCRQMMATVEPKNLASVRLFESAGFLSIRGPIPDYYGEDEDMIVYERGIAGDSGLARDKGL